VTTYDDHDQGDGDHQSNDDHEPDAGTTERCAEAGVLGACDAPADMHCPGCGRALCFACAGDHCKSAAPACGPGTRTSSTTSPEHAR